MKLNPLERWFVRSPIRRAMQALVVQWFRAVMPLPPGSDILEIGCGAGAGARMVIRQFKPRHLLLTDLDPLMISRAQVAVEQNTTTSTGFCICDAARLPFREACIDAVFGMGFLHHVPAWRDSLREVHRVLKPGGVYYMEEYYPSLYQNIITRRLAAHPEHDRFESDDLREGFAEVELTLRYTFELKRFGILGVGVKRDGVKDSSAPAMTSSGMNRMPPASLNQTAIF